MVFDCLLYVLKSSCDNMHARRPGCSLCAYLNEAWTCVHAALSFTASLRGSTYSQVYHCPDRPVHAESL